MSDQPIIDIVDDDAAMRDSLTFLLEVNGFTARAHDSAAALLQQLPHAPPDCVVSDIRMPGINGLELIRKFRADGIACPVIAVTGHGDVALAVEAMKAGAADFIEKPFEDAVLLAAIRSTLTARQDVPAQGRREADDRLAALSPRERDVLQGLVSGKINKVIAHDLGISPRTVEVYRANLMAKTAARSLSDLMRLALTAGL